MSVPLSQMLAVTRHVLTNRLRAKRRYALVLMLEPLFRCNLACTGCGKIQHPQNVLRRHLTPEQCFEAVRQCGAPIVSIPGGEPLLHPQIAEIVAGLIARRKYVYLCTNALVLEQSLDQFQPSKYLVFSVHLDGPRPLHDKITGRPGAYDTAVRAIRTALTRGFRVTTNITLFAGADPEMIRGHFDAIMQLGVEGMMLSPGFAYSGATDQQGFLQRRQVEHLFRQLLGKARPAWRFNQTPLFLQFLQGKYDLECTPWGNPTYNLFGWQKPCYLLDDGYCKSFQKLLASTPWNRYGRASGHAACQNCMVHSGYEPSAVHATLGTLRGMWRTIRLQYPRLFQKKPTAALPEPTESEQPLELPSACR